MKVNNRLKSRPKRFDLFLAQQLSKFQDQNDGLTKMQTFIAGDVIARAFDYGVDFGLSKPAEADVYQNNRERDMQYRQTKAQEKIAIKGEELVAVLNVANKDERRDISWSSPYSILTPSQEDFDKLVKRVEAFENQFTVAEIVAAQKELLKLGFTQDEVFNSIAGVLDLAKGLSK